MIHTSFPAAWVLAQVSPFESAGQYLNRPISSQFGSVFWIATLAVGVLWLIVTVLDKLSSERAAVLESRLPWDELVRAHHLSGEDERLLRQVAQTQHVRDPLEVFVNPAHLDQFRERKEESSESASQLIERLFGKTIALALETNRDRPIPS